MKNKTLKEMEEKIYLAPDCKNCIYRLEALEFEEMKSQLNKLLDILDDEFSKIKIRRNQ